MPSPSNLTRQKTMAPPADADSADLEELGLKLPPSAQPPSAYPSSSRDPFQISRDSLESARRKPNRDGSHNLQNSRASIHLRPSDFRDPSNLPMDNGKGGSRQTPKTSVGASTLKTAYTHPADIKMAEKQQRFTTLRGDEKATQENWAQKKIEATGVCVAGYKWLRLKDEDVKGFQGYRCAGGHHLMSDSLLAEGKGGFYYQCRTPPPDSLTNEIGLELQTIQIRDSKPLIDPTGPRSKATDSEGLKAVQILGPAYFQTKEVWYTARGLKPGVAPKVSGISAPDFFRGGSSAADILGGRMRVPDFFPQLPHPSLRSGTDQGHGTGMVSGGGSPVPALNCVAVPELRCARGVVIDTGNGMVLDPKTTRAKNSQNSVSKLKR